MQKTFLYGRYIVALILLGAGLLIPGCRTNPVTGEKQFLLVNPQQELAAGDRYHPNIILSHDGEYRGKELKRYLGTIVERLHECSHRPDTPIDFTVLNTSMVNAFAIPGHVYCTRGFLAEMENEAQFAAVMGHELGHVTAMHSARQMTTDMLLGLGTAAAGSALADTEGGEAMLTAGLVGVKVIGLSYSREQERQADRLGTYYMALAGWDPREAVAAQRILHSDSGNSAGVFAPYLSTHPQVADRLEQIRSVISNKRLLQRDLLQGNGVYEDRWERRLSRLRKVDKAFEPYDKGMELIGKGEYQKALDAAERAISARSDQTPFFRLKGDALFALERNKKAREAYRHALELYPRYVLATMGLGEIALSTDNYEKAERHFKTVVKSYPASLKGRWGLGRSRYKQGEYRAAVNPLRQVAQAAERDKPLPHYMLAVSYDRIGDLRGAWKQYKTALSKGIRGEARRVARIRFRQLSERFAQNAGES